MLDTNNIAKLLGMEDVIVTEIQEEGTVRYINVEMKRRAQQCPCCGEITTSVHDYRLQKVKDIDAFGVQTIYRYRKRRYICQLCGKKFAESTGIVSRYKRNTKRLIEKIISDFHELRSASQIAKENHVSITTAIRYFDQVEFKLKALTEAISVDEFKGNAGGNKFQTILANPKTHKILDILPTRKAEDLKAYFMSYPNRNQVKYITMDMSKLYFDVMKECFPKATIVIDKFHVARQAQWALENVRKEVQSHLSPEYRKYFKRSRFLLLKRKKNLQKDEEKLRLALMLEISPRLAEAYFIKEMFLDTLESKSYEEAKKALIMWIAYTEAKRDELPEFHDCLRAVHNWDKYILNAFSTGLSNGFTEGCNNKTKVLKRTCFGVRNFDRFRNRILYCSRT